MQHYKVNIALIIMGCTYMLVCHQVTCWCCMMRAWRQDCYLQKTQQRPQSQQVCVSNGEATSQPKTITGTYIRHRQTSRLANRFQRHDDYDAESGVAEEFDDWRSARAKLKSREQQWTYCHKGRLLQQQSWHDCQKKWLKELVSSSNNPISFWVTGLD